ncbi:MAG: hypothetical protein GKR90_14240 [Pseudomonadales bacterium]|nr:hypothetical protein [Pseudomonadales bacterium]
MATLRTAHHGVTVTDLQSVQRAFNAVGFTHQSVGGVLAWSVDMPESARWMHAQMEPAFGDFRSLVLENPTTHQQLFLIETAAHLRQARASDVPFQSDLTIVVPVNDSPMEAYQQMRAQARELSFSEPRPIDARNGIEALIDSQRYLLTNETSSPTPYAILHYHPDTFASLQRTFESKLGVHLEELPEVSPGARRFVFADMAARVEIEVCSETPIATAQVGKRYPGANYLRLTDIDLDHVALQVGDPVVPLVPPTVASGEWQWCFPIAHNAGYVYGPCDELIEIYDRNVVYDASPPYCPEMESANLQGSS